MDHLIICLSNIALLIDSTIQLGGGGGGGGGV